MTLNVYMGRKILDYDQKLSTIIEYLVANKLIKADKKNKEKAKEKAYSAAIRYLIDEKHLFILNERIENRMNGGAEK